MPKLVARGAEIAVVERPGSGSICGVAPAATGGITQAVLEPHHPILVIDDDNAFREFMAELLSFAELDATFWQPPVDPLALIMRTQPAVITLDLRLGHAWSGQEILQQMSSDPLLCRTTVIVCSADIEAMECLAMQCEPGSYCFITKPFDIDDLLTALRQSIAFPVS